MLVEHIEANPSDPGLEEELDALRSVWRSLEESERAEAVGEARALAEAQARAAREPRPLDDDAEAELALSGLDRIGVDAPPERRYDGPVIPMRCWRISACARSGPGNGRRWPRRSQGATVADHYRRLLLGGHPAAMIASGMDPGAAARALGDVRGGARFVLCSPERVASSSFLAALAQRTVDLFAAYEAQCVSELLQSCRLRPEARCPSAPARAFTGCSSRAA